MLDRCPRPLPSFAVRVRLPSFLVWWKLRLRPVSGLLPSSNRSALARLLRDLARPSAAARDAGVGRVLEKPVQRSLVLRTTLRVLPSKISTRAEAEPHVAEVVGNAATQPGQPAVRPHPVLLAPSPVRLPAPRVAGDGGLLAVVVSRSRSCEAGSDCLRRAPSCRSHQPRSSCSPSALLLSRVGSTPSSDG